jgi:hypothetical protein
MNNYLIIFFLVLFLIGYLLKDEWFNLLVIMVEIAIALDMFNSGDTTTIDYLIFLMFFALTAKTFYTKVTGEKRR